MQVRKKKVRHPSQPCPVLSNYDERLRIDWILRFRLQPQLVVSPELLEHTLSRFCGPNDMANTPYQEHVGGLAVCRDLWGFQDLDVVRLALSPGAAKHVQFVSIRRKGKRPNVVLVLRSFRVHDPL